MKYRTRTGEIRKTRGAPLAWRVFRVSRVPSFVRFFLAKLWDYSQSRYPISELCNQEERRNRLVSYQLRLGIFVSTVSHWPWKPHGYHICNVELPWRMQKNCHSKYVVPATATSSYRLCHADNKTKTAVRGCLVPARVIWVCACVRWWPKRRGWYNIKGAFHS